MNDLWWVILLNRKNVSYKRACIVKTGFLPLAIQTAEHHLNYSSIFHSPLYLDGIIWKSYDYMLYKDFKKVDQRIYTTDILNPEVVFHGHKTDGK